MDQTSIFNDGDRESYQFNYDQVARGRVKSTGSEPPTQKKNENVNQFKDYSGLFTLLYVYFIEKLVQSIKKGHLLFAGPIGHQGAARSKTVMAFQALPTNRPLASLPSEGN